MFHSDRRAMGSLIGKDDLDLNIIDFDLINAIKLMYKEKKWN